MAVTVLLYFMLLLALNVGGIEPSKPGVILTTSSTIIPGTSHKACLTFHHVTGRAHVHLRLEDEQPIAEKILNLDSEVIESVRITCMDLEIPEAKLDYNLKANLILNITFDSLPDYKVDESKDVEISKFKWRNRCIIFIECDRQLYGPNDIVKIRVLRLDINDFKPLLEPIPNVMITSPAGVRVEKWMNVSTNAGIAQIEFALPADPETGAWTILVGDKAKSHVSFDVLKTPRISPQFNILIEDNSKLADSNETSSYKICGKHHYGKPVHGTMQVLVNIFTNGHNNKGPLSGWEVTDKSGCVDYTFKKIEEFSTVIVKGSLKEDGTDMVENFTIVTEFGDTERLQLEFVAIESIAKPGMIYTSLVKVFVGEYRKPAANANIQICLEQCKTYTSNERGLVMFQYMLVGEVSPGNEDVEKTIKAQFENIDSEMGVSHQLKSWPSPSASYLNILRPVDGYDRLRCGKTYSFNIEYKTSLFIPKEFHYIIQSRTNIVNYSTIQNNIEDAIQYNNYNLRNILLSSNTTNDTIIDVPTVNIDIKVTSNMSPESSLLVYYVNDDGEIVSASLTFAVEKCFNNEVSQIWSNTKPNFGETVNLHLSTSPNSVCAVSSGYKSSNYPTDLIYQNFDLEGVIGVKAINGDPENCRKIIGPQPYTQYPNLDFNRYDDDVLINFDNAGLLVISDFEMETPKCSIRKEKGDVDIPLTYRSIRPAKHYPENWLWELEHVGADGELDISVDLPQSARNLTVSTYCISPELGLGVASTPALPLTIEQPFFIDFSAPDFLKENEIIDINIKVFNYMPDSLPVNIETKSMDGLTVIMKDRMTSSVCIDSEEETVIPIPIQARDLGKLNITVTASIDANDQGKCGPGNIIYKRTISKLIMVQSSE